MAQSNDREQSSSRTAPAVGEFEDCTACRVLGAATFIGLGAYTLTIQPDAAPTPKGRAKPFIPFLTRYAPAMRGGLGLSFIALGVYRLVS